MNQQDRDNLFGYRAAFGEEFNPRDPPRRGGRGQGRGHARGGMRGRRGKGRGNEHGAVAGDGRAPNRRRDQERPAQDGGAAAMELGEAGIVRGRGGDRRGRGGQRTPHPIERRGGIKFLTQAEIEDLASKADPSKIVQCVMENEGGFLAAYSHLPNCRNPLVLKRLITLLHLLVNSENQHLASRIVAHIFGDNTDTSAFLRHLEDLIRKMPTEQRDFVRRENPHYLKCIIEIGAFAIVTVPQSVMYSFPYPSLNDTIKKLSLLRREDVGLLQTQAESLADEFSRVLIVSCSPKVLSSTEKDSADVMPPPPQHFTDLPVLPSTEELQPDADEPYLRPNITTGGYEDWEHYLDVQFRLLREDFIAPLRDGIQLYEPSGISRKHLSEVRVYEKVNVRSPVCLPSGTGFQIHFDISKLLRVNWEHSRRLIFGSLLCLSRDNFQTMMFATVAKRDPKLLADGLVIVRFEHDGLENAFQINPDQLFVMVESTAYFEAYRHILVGLQRASTEHTTDKLPIFKRYLVNCQFENSVPPPEYLLYSGRPTFRLKEVLDIKVGSPDVILTNPDNWPHCEHTCLDASQLRAFHAALTQEVSVIQGPPGTGKTFIGLKVVEALVANQRRSRTSNFPILVLCYTNHALDQFLEGILQIKTPENKELNIVRIGGRCKTEKLEHCILRAKVDRVRSQKLLPANLHKKSGKLYRDVQMLRERIEAAQKSIDATINGDKIFKLSALEEFIPENHLFQLTQEKPTERGREIDVWLKLWYVFEDEEALEPLLQDPLVQEEVIPIIDDNAVGIQVEPEEELIDVDAEANRIEEERILEGELFDFPVPRRRANSQNEQLFVSNTAHIQMKNDEQWSVVQISDEERRRRIRRGYLNQPMTDIEAISVINIWNISLKNRWRLYQYWVNQLIVTRKQLVARTARMYNELCKEFTVCQQDIDAHVIRGADIIGMTTTGAAKYNHILSNIYPKIVIIEEAAEVFEAHVFTSLTPSVQQLIMIGDHKQLKPKANCYKLEKKFEFCVSLFERLARNDFPVFTLEVQHRMRPEIASLICPSIYKNLLNHKDVECYEHVKGVGTDLFFIDHHAPEKDIDDKDRSHSNDHEAEFLVALCKYLLKQGYRPDQITLLTMYRGQLLELRKKMRRRDYDGVRVAAVDDFQGEENDLILLSLVRSNSEKKIGFLNIPNRICVSLSRAKVGFYVIGNLLMLRDRHDTVWPEILMDLLRKHCTGKALPLYCQNHPQTVVMASCAKDFLKCPEGGCQQKCSVRLNCGHSCPRLCHPIDKEHEHVHCRQKCSKILKCGHYCKNQCWKCKDGCLPCNEIVTKRIYSCGHEIQMQCHEDPLTYSCTKPCERVLRCGHRCQELCATPCTRKCFADVAKMLPCSHTRMVPCFLDAGAAECREVCNERLDCGHACSGNCQQCRKGRLHIRCQSKCGRTLVCGHECKFPCTPTCPPCMMQCNNYCVHSRCSRRCYERCIPCKEPCTWQCEHHKCTRLCGEICNRPPCDQPCKLRLRCGHQCIGLCGEKCPSKCRICDRDEVCEIFFGTEEDEDARFVELEECKHLIEVTALDAWMEQVGDESKPFEVQFKTCPKCKTQIRKSLRYGKYVKQTLKDYENIKEKQLINLSSDLLTKFAQVQIQAKKVASASFVCLEESLKLIDEILQPSTGTRKYKTALPPHQINNINAQLTYLTSVVRMLKYLTSLQSPTSANVHRIISAISTVGIKDIQEDIVALVNFLMQDFLSDQHKTDIQSEIYRLMSLIKLLDLWCKTKTRGIILSASDNQLLASKVERAQNGGWKSDTFKEEEHDETISFVKRISAEYSVDGLTESERIAIVKAIGLTKGHWFKCPNGHYYCIGECGGATEEGNCPDCGKRIGGQSHALRADNQFAPEMDGARYAAWSEAANNMDNFDLDHLR